MFTHIRRPAEEHAENWEAKLEPSVQSAAGHLDQQENLGNPQGPAEMGGANANLRQQIQNCIHNFLAKSEENLEKEIIDNLSPRSYSAILALHLKRDFGNAIHVVELRSLHKLQNERIQLSKNPPRRPDGDVGRGNRKDQEVECPKGIEGFNKTIYANDLKVLTTYDPAGTKQNGLQEAVYRNDAYLWDCSLAFAPEKSELLILKKQTSQSRPPKQPDPELTINGLTIVEELLALTSGPTMDRERMAVQERDLLMNMPVASPEDRAS
ncbi:hypothetical protein HPB47_000338 [Ixodes persulcatus]|uniref:Uncharacterized protein n=1 Tax=Ixodes persulcatus TaxID=34615 RepID=A0AC60PS07_IXOPE|nr:hypothetical protein HPB47_000338 [Ixodes persulcatus]